jgi:preprotein translocase subunit YajC
MNLAAFLLQAAPAQNPILGFLPVLLIFGIFYFLLFLPMQRQKKQMKQMLESLKTGDEIVTTGGLIGTIFAINPDDTLILRLRPDNIKVQVSRSAVAGTAATQTKSS